MTALLAQSTTFSHPHNISYYCGLYPTIMGFMQFQAPLYAMTPTLDGDVLAVLARVDNGFTVPQLTALLPDCSREGIRKTLNRLVEGGLVSREAVGRTGLYRLNRQHLLAPAVIDIVNARERFIDRLRTLLQSWDPPPVFAALFGSAASGTMRPDSDIDVFLVRPDGVEDGSWSRQVGHLVTEASEWSGNDVRPLVFDLEHLFSSQDSEPVVRDILEAGIPILGSPQVLGRDAR